MQRLAYAIFVTAAIYGTQRLAHAIFVCYLWHAVVGLCSFLSIIYACSGWLLMLLLFQETVGCQRIATAPYCRLVIQQYPTQLPLNN